MITWVLSSCRKLLSLTLIFSLLWPDMARCMNEEEEETFTSLSVTVPNKNVSDLKEKKSSSENLKSEVKDEQVKETSTQTENTQKEKEPFQSFSPKQENVTEEKPLLTETKTKEENPKNTTTIETNPSHDPKKEEEKENEDSKFSNNSSKENNPEIPNQIIEEEFSLGKNNKNNKRNDESLDYSLFQEKKPNSLCSCFKGIFNCCTKKKFEMKGISEKTRLLINDEDNIEEDSKKGNVQDSQDKNETPSQKYAQLLNFDLEEWGKEEQIAWQELLKVEGTWRNPLIWANLENLIHKALFALTTNKSAIIKKKGEKTKKCCDPLWLYGGPVPLMDSSAIKRNVTLKTLGNAFQDGVADTIETILTGLLGYQVYELFHSGTWKLLTFKTLVEFYEGADNTSYIAVINTLSEHPALFALFAIPIGFAALKTLWNVSHISKPTEENIKKTVENLHDPKSLKWDSKFFSLISLIPSVSSLLMFHPTKSAIPGLALPILWKGDLDSEDRQKAFNAIVQLANKREGITQMTAIESLKYLAHGMHPKNLMNIPHSVEELAKIKAGALHALQEVYKKLHPLSVTKARTAMHLWEIGQSPSLAVSIVAPVIKAVLAAFYGYSLYQLGRFLYDYFKCSNKYKTRFTWINSINPGYVNDFSKDCFDAQVKVFNLIPGQPAYTLVGRDPASTVAGNLSAYYFPNNSYDLDLSNRGLSLSVIADIVEGFKLANSTVSLNSLNIANYTSSQYMDKNSEDLSRILEALPSTIKNLDMSSVDTSVDTYSPNSFLGLGRLTSLQNLDLTNNAPCSYDNGVMGQVLQNLLHLRDLRLRYLLNTNLTQVAEALKPSLQLLDLTCINLDQGIDHEGQIAFGEALAKNLTLHYLYLAQAGIGTYSEGNKAFSQGLKAQTQLEVLDLSKNQFGYPNVSVSTLLESLPSSMTNLDISGNSINETSAINATALAVQRMLGLVSFKAKSNALGYFPDFLKALHGKQNLTFLDLSQNSFNDSTRVKNLLLTTPYLKILDFSHNQLTNGSMLVSVLSNLRNLKSLNLGNNSFTTEDRIKIWNATSSLLSQSPFYLDEDPDFTTYYLHNFLSNTTALNFANLIQNNTTAFDPIMNQTVTLFPNLESLDLSNNVIVGSNNRTEGIKALIHYLHKLTRLKTLRISNGIDNSGDTPEVENCFENLSYTIGQLPNLHFLDLSNTYGLFSPDFLGQGLNKSYSLRLVNLGSCFGEFQRKLELIKGLQVHPHLTHLDLSNNFIGAFIEDNFSYSTHALADALQSWPRLQSLNLAFNWIGDGDGTGDPKGSAYFLEKLADLAVNVTKQGGTFNLSLNLVNGIHNIIWTNESYVFQNLTEQSILKACAKQLCSGGNITTQSKTKAPELQKEQHIAPVTSSATQLAPFYQPLVNTLKPWFSLESWSVWGDRVLDSVANGILSYSKQVAENAPGYFPGTLDKSKSPAEGRNKTFRNYPIPHFRAIDQGEPLDVQRFNHMQALPQSQGFNHTSSPLMISGGFQPLMITK